MNDREKGGDSRLSDSAVKNILDRAIEIDSRRASEMSLDNLRSIAREMGISEESVNEAIREHTLASRRSFQNEMRDVVKKSGEPKHGDAREGIFSGLSRWTRSALALAIPAGLLSVPVLSVLDRIIPSLNGPLVLIPSIGVTLLLGMSIALRPLKTHFVEGALVAASFWLSVLVAIALMVSPSARVMPQVFTIMTLFFAGTMGVAWLLDFFQKVSDSRREPQSGTGPLYPGIAD